MLPAAFVDEGAVRDVVGAVRVETLVNVPSDAVEMVEFNATTLAILVTDLKDVIVSVDTFAVVVVVVLSTLIVLVVAGRVILLVLARIVILLVVAGTVTELVIAEILDEEVDVELAEDVVDVEEIVPCDGVLVEEDVLSVATVAVDVAVL